MNWTENNSYGIVANAIREFWEKEGPCDVIAFFEQKYDFEPGSKWTTFAEFATPESYNNYDTVLFNDDFCEGEDCVRNLTVVAFDEVAGYFLENVLKKREVE